MLRYFLISAFCFLAPLQAEQVKAVSSTQKAFLSEEPTTESWKVGDTVCASQGGKRVACGKIVKFSDKGVFVSVKKRNGEIQKGAAVSRVGRSLASTGGGLKEKFSRNRPVNFDLSGGFQFSLKYLIPYVHVDYVLTDHVTVGVGPSFFTVSSSAWSVAAIGLHLTGSYYQNSDLLGFMGKVGLTPYFYLISSPVTPLASSTEIMLGGYMTGGYQLRIGKQFAANALLGFNYLPLPETMGVAFDYSSLQPMGMVSFGFLF